MPAVRLRLSGRQPFSLGLPLAPRADAGVEGPRQRAHRRRVSAAADDEHARLRRVSWPASSATSRTSRSWSCATAITSPTFPRASSSPEIDDATIAKRIAVHDPRYFTTYYAIDAVNFKPADHRRRARNHRGPVSAAGRARRRQACRSTPSFDEQKRIMQRCNGLFYDCNGGAEARRFNRLLIDAGMIKAALRGPVRQEKR